MRAKKAQVLIVFIFLLGTVIINSQPSEDSSLQNIKQNLKVNQIDEMEAFIEANAKMQLKETDESKKKDFADFIDEMIKKIDENAKSSFKDKNYENALKNIISLKTLNKPCSVNIRDVYNKMLEDAASKDIFTQDDIKEEIADMQLYSNDEVFNFLKFRRTGKAAVFFYTCMINIPSYIPGFCRLTLS